MRWPHNQGPAALEFEFQPQRARMRRGGWVLWSVALAFCTDVAWSYVKTRQSLQALGSELAAVPAGQAGRPQKAYEPRNPEREVSFARATLRKIATPWSALFRELGASAVAGVSVVSVQPDPDSRALQLSAQADTIASMLNYVGRLESNPFFGSVALVRHELKSDEPGTPVSFLLLATWNGAK